MSTSRSATGTPPGGGSAAGSEKTRDPIPTGPPRKLEEADLDELIRRVPRYLRERGRTHGSGKEEPNPRAVFILGPPRSGARLLLRTLSEHPGLFTVSGLNLLNFVDLQQRREALAPRGERWLEASVRTVMELRGCDATRARHIHRSLERQRLPTRAFYRMLQWWTEGRTLVEWTPAYALDGDTLEKAEQDFREPVYIHLVRHPRTAVAAFEDGGARQLLLRDPDDFSPRELGELVWLASHQNIERFLGTIPEHRKVRVRLESLEAAPGAHVARTLARIGVPAAGGPADAPHGPPPGPVNGKGRADGRDLDPPLGDRTLALARALGYRGRSAVSFRKNGSGGAMSGMLTFSGSVPRRPRVGPDVPLGVELQPRKRRVENAEAEGHA